MSSHQALPVPPHLQDRHYGGAAKLGRGLDYKYAHDYPNHYVKQQYLPDGMEGTVFYRPTEMGYEKQVGEHLDFLRRSAEHLEFIKRTLENRRKNERREAKALGRGSHDCGFSGRSGDGGSAVFKIPSQLWGFLAGGGGVRAGEERISQPHLSGPHHHRHGKYPANHGIVNNLRIQPRREKPDWFWQRRFVRGETLYDLVRERGGRTAALLWPVTGKAGIRWNLPEVLPNRPWQNQITASFFNGSPLYELRLRENSAICGRGCASLSWMILCRRPCWTP